MGRLGVHGLIWVVNLPFGVFSIGKYAFQKTQLQQVVPRRENAGEGNQPETDPRRPAHSDSEEDAAP